MALTLIQIGRAVAAVGTRFHGGDRQLHLAATEQADGEDMTLARARLLSVFIAPATGAALESPEPRA